MDYLKLKATYDDLLERIDQYFDRELIHEPRARANLEIYKDELLQTLQIELWKNHNKETYKTYDPEKFIWIKAEKIWIAFTRRLNQKSNLKSNIEFTDLPETSLISNFLQQYESRDAVAVIESLLSESEIELLRFRSQGLTYKQIKDLTSFPSAAAAKTKFNRVKNFIRLRFGRL